MLILLSWLCSAAFPASGIHSLLSGEGLRWFFGHFSKLLAKPLLADLLLLAIACGCLVRSRIWPLGRSYRERRALWLSLSWLVVCSCCSTTYHNPSRHSALRQWHTLALTLLFQPDTRHCLQRDDFRLALWNHSRSLPELQRGISVTT